MTARSNSSSKSSTSLGVESLYSKPTAASRAKQNNLPRNSDHPTPSNKWHVGATTKAKNRMKKNNDTKIESSSLIIQAAKRRPRTESLLVSSERSTGNTSSRDATPKANSSAVGKKQSVIQKGSVKPIAKIQSKSVKDNAESRVTTSNRSTRKETPSRTAKDAGTVRTTARSNRSESRMENSNQNDRNANQQRELRTAESDMVKEKKISQSKNPKMSKTDSPKRKLPARGKISSEGMSSEDATAASSRNSGRKLNEEIRVFGPIVNDSIPLPGQNDAFWATTTYLYVFSPSAKLTIKEKLSPSLFRVPMPQICFFKLKYVVNLVKEGKFRLAAVILNIMGYNLARFLTSTDETKNDIIPSLPRHHPCRSALYWKLLALADLNLIEQPPQEKDIQIAINVLKRGALLGAKPNVELQLLIDGLSEIAPHDRDHSHINNLFGFPSVSQPAFAKSMEVDALPISFEPSQLVPESTELSKFKSELSTCKENSEIIAVIGGVDSPRLSRGFPSVIHDELFKFQAENTSNTKSKILSPASEKIYEEILASPHPITPKMELPSPKVLRTGVKSPWRSARHAQDILKKLDFLSSPVFKKSSADSLQFTQSIEEPADLSRQGFFTSGSPSVSPSSIILHPVLIDTSENKENNDILSCNSPNLTISPKTVPFNSKELKTIENWSDEESIAKPLLSSPHPVDREGRGHLSRRLTLSALMKPQRILEKGRTGPRSARTTRVNLKEEFEKDAEVHDHETDEADIEGVSFRSSPAARKGSQVHYTVLSPTRKIRKFIDDEDPSLLLISPVRRSRRLSTQKRRKSEPSHEEDNSDLDMHDREQVTNGQGDIPQAGINERSSVNTPKRGSIFKHISDIPDNMDFAWLPNPTLAQRRGGGTDE